MDESFGVGDLGPDACLAVLERFDWQRIGHVGVDELLLVAFEFSQSSAPVDDEGGCPTPLSGGDQRERDG